MAEPVSKFLFTPIPADVIIQLSQAIRNNDSAALAAVFTTKHLISNGTPTSDSHVRSRETTPRESGSLSRSRSEDGPTANSASAKALNASKGQLMLLFHAPLCAEQDTALLFGVRHSSLDAVRFLLDCGADVLEQHSVTGDSALHIAAKIGDVDMVKLLLNRDGDVTARNHEGKTPMEVIHPAKQSILKPMFSQAITERSTSLPSLSHLRNSAIGSPNKPITNISPSPPLTRSPRSAFSPVVRKSIHSPSRLNIETNASSTSSHASVSSIPVAQDNILPAAARDSFSTPSFLSGVIASPPSAQAGSPGRAVPVLARFSPPSISPRITGANQTPTAPQSEISPTTNATASSAWQTRSSQGLSSSFQDRLFISPVPTSPHHTHGISDPTQNATSSAFQRPRYVSMPEFQDFTSVGRSESNQSLHLSDGDRQPKQPVPAHHHHALSAYDTTSSNSFNSGQHSAQSSPGGTMPRGRSTHNIVTSNVKMLESVQGSPGTAAIASPARPSATTDLTYLPPLRSIKPRHLWVADGLRSACFRCHRGFSFFFRRHHCRVCGEVVCDNCSLGRLPYLFAFADAFIETGIPSSSYVPELPYSACTEMVRVCDGCVSARRADFEVRCQGLAAPVL